MAFAQRHWGSNSGSGQAGVLPGVPGSQCQLPGAAPGKGSCSTQCAPISPRSSKHPEAVSGREGEAGRGFQRSPGTREPGLCSAASPRASDAHVGAGAPPPPGPSSRRAGWIRDARQAAGRGAHPHHAAVSHRAPAPPPTPTNSALPGNRRRAGPPGGAQGPRFEPPAGWERREAPGPGGLPQSRDPDQACRFGGHRGEGEGDSCGAMGRTQGVARQARSPPGCPGEGTAAQGPRCGVRGTLRSWANSPRWMWGNDLLR